MSNKVVHVRKRGHNGAANWLLSLLDLVKNSQIKSSGHTGKGVVISTGAHKTSERNCRL